MVEVFENVEVKENVREIISKLRRDGHEVIFITTRDGAFIDDSYTLTKNWLDKNNIEYATELNNYRAENKEAVSSSETQPEASGCCFPCNRFRI